MLSILIPSLSKNKEYLDLCTRSLSENTCGDFEILVDIDDTCGQCVKVNRLAKKAKGEWLFICNDDMYFPPMWNKDIKYISECFSPNVNWTHTPIAGLDYAEIWAGRTIEEFNQELVDGFMNEYSNPIVENGFHFPVFFSKRLWDLIEGYDENYDPYGSNSDSDLEYKAIIAGVQPKIDRNGLVYHFGGISETFKPDKQEYWQKNWDYFIDKWGVSRAETPDIQKADIKLDTKALKFNPKWSVYK